MRSGHLAPTNTAGTFGYAGQAGGWWSSYALTGNNEYTLWMNNTVIMPNNAGVYRYGGFPLRCLSTVLGM